MKPKLAILVLAAVCLGTLTLGSAARAQNPYLYSYGYYPWLGGAGWQDLPYYALFPPVYYNGVTPRAYGHSPVFYGLDAGQYEAQPSQPAVVINQFATSRVTVPTPAEAAGPAPLLIKNPYVQVGPAPKRSPDEPAGSSPK